MIIIIITITITKNTNNTNNNGNNGNNSIHNKAEYKNPTSLFYTTMEN